MLSKIKIAPYMGSIAISLLCIVFVLSSCTATPARTKLLIDVTEVAAALPMLEQQYRQSRIDLAKHRHVFNDNP